MNVGRGCCFLITRDSPHESLHVLKVFRVEDGSQSRQLVTQVLLLVIAFLVIRRAWKALLTHLEDRLKDLLFVQFLTMHEPQSTWIIHTFLDEF